MARKKKEKFYKVEVVGLDDLDQSPVKGQKRLEDFLEEQCVAEDEIGPKMEEELNELSSYW